MGTRWRVRPRSLAAARRSTRLVTRPPYFLSPKVTKAPNFSSSSTRTAPDQASLVRKDVGAAIARALAAVGKNAAGWDDRQGEV